MTNTHSLFAAGLLAAAVMCCIGARRATAQLAPSMIGDRPGQVESMTTPETIQLESGVSYESRRSAVPVKQCDRSWVAGTLLRSGMLNEAELRIGFEYASEASRISSEINRDHGLRNLSIGTKVRLLDTTAGAPALYLFANAHMPFGQDDYRPDAIIPGMRLQMDCPFFNEAAMLSCSLGGEWRVGSYDMISGYTTTLAVPLASGFSMFGDISGQFTLDDSPVHVCDLGVAYAVREFLVLDFAGGIGLTPNASDYFFSGGICCHLP
ncbi:MAG: transporter [Bacteroidetes bacterium]|nr:transporter [Bacteroidota bacterium]